MMNERVWSIDVYSFEKIFFLKVILLVLEVYKCMYKTSYFFKFSKTLRYDMLHILRLTYVHKVTFLSRIYPMNRIRTLSKIIKRSA